MTIGEGEVKKEGFKWDLMTFLDQRSSFLLEKISYRVIMRDYNGYYVKNYKIGLPYLQISGLLSFP